MEKSIFSKVYMWMCVGLFITFFSSFAVYTSPWALNLIFGSSLYYVIIIAEIAVAIFLSARLTKMSKNTAIVLYLLYTFLTGLTFASIFVLFTMTSIISVFLISAIVFLVFAMIGRVTSIDLTKLGTFLLMALLGIIILEIVNIFILSETLNMFTCIVGLIIFFGYIAYDIQKIKRMSTYGIEENKLAIYGAFELYLDFINVFIRLLELLGKSKD